VRGIEAEVTSTDARTNGALTRLWIDKDEVERGESVEIDLTDAEKKDAKATGYFEFGEAAAKARRQGRSRRGQRRLTRLPGPGQGRRAALSGRPFSLSDLQAHPERT